MAKINHMPLISHAIQNGNLVFIDNVSNGLSCNCVCTKCGELLVAKNNGLKRANHFTHYKNSKCNGESYVHYLSKIIIAKKKYIWVPIDVKQTDYNTRNNSQVTTGWIFNECEFEYDPDNQIFSNKNGIIKAKKWKVQRKVLQKVSLDKVEIEKRIGNSEYVADLTCHHISGKTFIIEIVVTNAPNKEKTKYLIDNEIDTLIITLNNNSYKEKDFDKKILCYSNREWLYNKKLKVGYEYGKHWGTHRHRLPSGKIVYLEGWINDNL